jgi:hypothetical protein
LDACESKERKRLDMEREFPVTVCFYILKIYFFKNKFVICFYFFIIFKLF